MAGTFFLLNVVIAVVCNTYNAQKVKDAEERDEFRRRKLDRAFTLLEGPNHPGGLRRDKIEEVFKELNHYRILSGGKISPDMARVLWAALDTRGSGLVDREAFSNFCSLLAVRFTKADRTTWVGRAFPRFFASTFVQRVKLVVGYRFSREGACALLAGRCPFELTVDLLLLGNAVVLAAEEWGLLFHGNEV